MLSDLVYLYGNLFSPETNILHFREELPNGKKVDQKKLAHQLVLASLCELYAEGIIDLFLEEGKILFIKTQTAKATRLQDVKDLESLDGKLLKHLDSTKSIKDIVRMAISTSENPWEEITHMVKKHIQEKNVKKDDKKDEPQFTLYTKTLNTLKAKGNLLPKIHDGINEGLESREEKERGEE